MQALHAIKECIPFTDYAKIGFQIGTIEKVDPFAKARNPSYKVTVDFNGRTLTSSAQLPPNYPDMQELLKKQVITITNLPPRKIAGFPSQCLIVGFPDKDHHVHLLNTRGRNVDAGLRLDMNEKPPESIVYDDFVKADIRSATITEMTQMESDKDSYFAKVDVGSLGTRHVSIVDIDEKIAAELDGSQVAVVLNIKKECVHDPDTFVLTFKENQKRIPLGVDQNVENGVSLF